MIKFLESVLVKNKKAAILAALIILLLILVAAGLILERKSRTLPQIQQPRLVKTEKSQEEAVVEITKAGLIPQTIRIKKGGVVSFINKDTQPHQIASDPHPVHNLYPFLNTDEVLNNSDSVTVTFEKTGTFTFHDHLNPLKYKGVVEVK